MSLIEQIGTIIEKEMFPVDVKISECAEGIMLYGRFLDKAEMRIVSLSTASCLNEGALIDNIIGVAYSIKRDLLHATSDYTRTLSS